ncbi:MAG: hypothetical protein FOGNACKC_03318 [Anaerolineae bacterium]|mgnify:CR=1 FL=1|nr:hypothetical protein [Anaerolineae bacterium]
MTIDLAILLLTGAMASLTIIRRAYQPIPVPVDQSYSKGDSSW